MTQPRMAPAWQQAIIDKCFHPTGVWEEFSESDFCGSIPKRFEQIANIHPLRVAVKCSERSLSYEALNRYANRLSHLLLANYSDVAGPVLLYFQHDVWVAVAILAVLKSGKFYVCLDESNGSVHNRQILQNAGAKMLLTDQMSLHMAKDLVYPGVDLLNVEEIEWAGLPITNPNLPIDPSSLAYISYTSGSTGIPKGVMEEHQNVLYWARIYTNLHHVCPEDRLAFIIRSSFGGSATHVYPALLSGAGLYFFDLRQNSLTTFVAWLSQEKITYIASPVSIFRQIARLLPMGEAPSLRVVGISGEAIFPSDIALYQRFFPDTSFLRIGYGATEAHFTACLLLDKQTEIPAGRMSIGFPTQGTELCLWDDQECEVPVGTIGEIVVKRKHLTRGYWQDLEQTEQKYSQQPDAPDIRIYHTGDQGYRQADGSIVFAGRKDRLVKIRGYFVDPLRVETALTLHPQIVQSAVAARPGRDGSLHLVAYFTTHQNEQASIADIYHFLRRRLEQEEIPQRIIHLASLPSKLSGKIDYGALPDTQNSRPSLEVGFVPPLTPLEQAIAAIWRDALGLDEIGIHDPFLDLGGNSLQAMLIAARVAEEFGVEIPLAELFAASTVAEMALGVVAGLLNSTSARLLDGLLTTETEPPLISKDNHR